MISKNLIDKYKLDEEEIDLINEDIQEFGENETEKFFDNAIDNLKSRRNKSLSIRTNELVIDKIKTIANNNGLNYQTLINMILYQVANGKIDIRLVI